jgi:hypothetical protein
MVASVPLLAVALAVLYSVLPKSPGFKLMLWFALGGLALAAANLLLNIFSIVAGRNFSFPVKLNFLLTRLLAPFSFVLGRIFLTKEAMQRSFLAYNNRVVKAKKARFKPEEILLLLPRCIQNTECKNSVVTDMANCASCGKCDLAEIKKVVKETGIRAAVVTGGSQARELLKTLRPKAVVAIACERELLSGIFDSTTNYVFALLNSRPFGPCLNTKTDTVALRETLDAILRRA